MADTATQHGCARRLSPPHLPMNRLVRIWRGVRDPLTLLSEMESRFDIATLREGRVYAVFHPDHVKHILQDRHVNYQKGPLYRAALSFMGNGLFTSEGAFWLRQRRLAQGAFQRAHLSSFAGPALGCVSDFAALWTRKSRQGEAVALREELTELTLTIALRNLFSTDAEQQMPALLAAVHGVNDNINLGAVLSPVKLPAWLPTLGRRRFARSLQTIDDFIYRVIAKRRAASDAGTDLVGLLISARDPETGERMDDLQLRDELVTMLNAGHDTVTDAITWTLVLLCGDLAAQERARAEINAVAASGLTVESLGAMEFLGRVFRESLRLYPPGWGFARTAIEEDHIAGYSIPPGALVILSPYVVHRSSRYWDHPTLFDPDRFLPGPSAARPKFAYFPFGSGPRQCIGANLAMMEAPLITAALLQRFEFRLPEGTVVTPAPRISLRPKGTVWMRVRPLKE